MNNALNSAMNQPSELALDVRLMNALAYGMYALAGLLVLTAVLAWGARQPVFAIVGVSVSGDVTHYNANTLRANVMPHLSGTFFTLNLQAARKTFKTLPWVREAIVRRDFPNRLRVQLQEHQPVAYWGSDGDSRLVNSFGEVFEANLGELEQDDLPRLVGPEGQSAQVLAMWRLLQPALERADLRIAQLELSARGGWRGELDSGMALELGSGDAATLLARTDRFLSTVTQVTARFQRHPQQLASVDLRHSDGYAIRMDGVSTLAATDGKKK